MEHSYEDIVLMERYLDQSLTAEERLNVERRIAGEPSFKELYQSEKLLVDGIRYGHLRDRLEQLKSLEAGLGRVDAIEGGARVVDFMRFWKPLSIAAIVLIAAAWFLVSRQSMPENERLFAANFELFDSPGSGLTRSEGNMVPSLKASAYMAYDKGDYKSAVVLFEKALEKYDDPILMLCLGNSYLAINQPEKAEQVFKNMLERHQDLVTQAKWYLSLSYLKQNKLNRVKSILWEINNSSTYGEKAKKLLKELN